MPSRTGGVKFITESKPADVFAFGMLAVEVFTGRIPLEERGEEAVVLYILQGGRPKVPHNAQELGLTAGIWKLLEACWRQSPRKRPTMREVVKRWQKVVDNEDDLNTFPECVEATFELVFNPILNSP
jgi:hypothetical protein